MQRRPDPIPALKRRVASEILLLLDSWSQANAACLMGAWQARVSELRAGHLHRFSLDRLIRYLAHLDREVTIESKRIVRLSLVNHRAVDRTFEPRVAEFRAAHALARAAAEDAAAEDAAAAERAQSAGRESGKEASIRFTPAAGPAARVHAP